MRLKDKECKLIDKDTQPMEKHIIDIFSQQISKQWDVKEGKSLTIEYEFENFLDAIRFVNRIAEAAELKNHHPDIDIRYNKVKITLSTHAIGGLTENDFIMAAKIDEIRNYILVLNYS